MRRTVLLSLLVVALAGCASAEYHDNAAEVARDPRCIDKPSTPGQAAAPWCQPAAGTRWSSGKGTKVEFGGGGG